MSFVAVPGLAWHTEGHRRVAEDAVTLLPPEVPRFFREGAATVGHGAVDPDLWKLDALVELDDGESPEHYLDVENLRGHPWPPTRSQAERLYRRLRIEGKGTGYLPWSIVEGIERLAVGFAEHRARPDDPAIRAKCLVWAGWVAHYVGDLGQPLHTTIHHNGRTRVGKPSPGTGMHHKIDGLFERVELDRREVLRGVELRPVADLHAFVRERFHESHGLVDATYDLLPAIDGPQGMADPAVVAFTRERYRATARQTAEALLAAWRLSGEIELPSWLER
ncbi:MAG TPA: hypothetical protein VFT19_13510 [Solirubrobacterales bacterium]|nr:hypothetical protein [Solirubrobacterales bacterium]